MSSVENRVGRSFRSGRTWRCCGDCSGRRTAAGLAPGDCCDNSRATGRTRGGRWPTDQRRSDRFSRWAINSATSAGVMPLIRLAWSRLTGRIRESFWRASARRCAQLLEVEVGGNAFAGQTLLPLHLLQLPVDVARILHVVHDLEGDLVADLGELGKPLDEFRPAHFRPPQELGQRHIVRPPRFQQLHDGGDLALFRLQSLPALLVHQTRRDEPAASSGGRHCPAAAAAGIPLGW